MSHEYKCQNLFKDSYESLTLVKTRSHYESLTLVKTRSHYESLTLVTSPYNEVTSPYNKVTSPYNRVIRLVLYQPWKNWPRLIH